MVSNVATTSAAWQEMKPRLDLAQVLKGGTEAIRKAREDYLPRYEAESERYYDIRLSRSTLTNLYASALQSLVGRVYAKPIVLGDDMPSQAKLWAEDIDLAGNNLDTFGAQVLEAAISDGLTHILVDHPPAKEGQTLAAERASGARPYFVHVPAMRLLFARREIISGREAVTHARVYEPVVMPDDRWGEVLVERIRVLEPGLFEIWEKKDQQWEMEDSGKTSLTFVPLVTLYTKRTGFMTARPPLTDLADLQVAHWQSASDQRNILTMSRFPMLGASGLSDGEAEKVTVGPHRILATENANGKYYYVEPTGQAIAAGRQDLLDLKEEMTLLSLEPLLPRSGAPTATARALDEAKANAPLKMWALAEKDALERAFEYAGEFAGIETGSLAINTDLGISMRDAADIEALIKARITGDLSRETLWEELKRRGVLLEDFDPEAELERLEEESLARAEEEPEEAPPA